VKTLLRFFREFGKERSKQLKFVCTDMWAHYLKVIKKKAPQCDPCAGPISYYKHINDAIDTVRREEARKYKGTNQEALLTNSRWPLLKNRRNCSEVS
jgi:transposase